VRVNAGESGSRPRFVVESRRAERGVKSLFGGSKRAGRRTTRSESRVVPIRSPPKGAPLTEVLLPMGSGHGVRVTVPAHSRVDSAMARQTVGAAATGRHCCCQSWPFDH